MVVLQDVAVSEKGASTGIREGVFSKVHVLSSRPWGLELSRAYIS